MTTPFRYNKKQRKRYREQAKAESKVADKLAAKGIDPQIVAAMRTMADINTRLSKSKRKKESKIKRPSRIFSGNSTLTRQVDLVPALKLGHYGFYD